MKIGSCDQEKPPASGLRAKLSSCDGLSRITRSPLTLSEYSFKQTVKTKRKLGKQKVFITLARATVG